METISGDFKCPKCGVENAVASLSSSTHYSTWMTWPNRWIIGCVGYENEKPIWWWDVFRYVHQENGDEKCWDIRGGSTEEDWIKGHYTWKCMACEYRTKTFKDFIENVETLDDENEYDDEYY